MGEVKVTDPLLMDTFEADDRGRINLGQDYADSEVEVIVESKTDKN